MLTLQQILHCDGRTDRLTYQRNVALLSFGKAMVDLITLSLTTTSAPLVAKAWINPFLLVAPWLQGAVPAITCLTTFALFAGLVWNTVHRLRDSGHPHWLGLCAAIPFAAPVVVGIACFIPSKRRTVWDLV